MRHFFLASFLILFNSFYTNSQSLQNELNGKVTDEVSKQPVGYASVILRSTGDSTVVFGTMADSSGIFRIEKIKPGNYQMRVSFIGFKTKIDTIVFAGNSNLILSDIFLQKDVTTLNDVTVETQRDAFQQNFEKKIFNVDRNNFSISGSTLDIMKQIPAINIDADGKISVRGGEDVQIFINGKPSGLNPDNRSQILEQIPANTIKSIELITNPSAKYDAEGMNGIINIVTKQNTTSGTNGSITLGAGYLKRGNVSGVLNYRKGKWSLSNNAGIKYTTSPARGTSFRENFLPGFPKYSIQQFSNGSNKNISYNLTGNTEFAISKKQTLTASYTGSIGNSDQVEYNNYNFLDSTDESYLRYYRNSFSENEMKNGNISLTYQNKFTEKTSLNISANSSLVQVDNTSIYTQQGLTLSGNEDTTSPQLSKAITHAEIFSNTAQTDFDFKIKKFSFESGLKGNYTIAIGSLYADSLNQQTGTAAPDSSRINSLDYNQSVVAAYITSSKQIGKIGIKGGVRAEQTMLLVQQLVNNNEVSDSYVNLFPSIFVNRKFTGDQEIQLSYSRRINRPQSMQLNPFPDYSDPLNIRIGNPNLKPELIDAYELNYQKYFPSHTISTTVFFRQVNNQIQRVRNIEPSGISIVSFQNLSYSQNAGIEIFTRHSFTKKISLNTNINAYRTYLNGNNLVDAYSNSGINLNLKIGTNIKFLKSFEFQANGNYQPKMILLQGISSPMYSVDASLRKDFWEGKGMLVLNWSDVFNSRAFHFYAYTSTFNADTYRKRDWTYVNLSFTVKMGQQSKEARKQNPMQDQQNYDMGY